jgi:PAS domain-containing protein
VADRSAIDGVVARRRRYTYFAVFAFGLVACLCIRDSTWRGDVQLHTLIETVATVLALAAGCLALVRYHSKKDNTFLLIGTAFAATGFLDAYHAVVSSAHFVATFPSSPPALFAWSWFASRIFLSLLLWLSWLLWRREDRLGAQGLVSERVLYGGVAGAAFASLALVQFVPMPVTYYLPLYFPRAQEFLPGLFLALALAGYLRKGKWKTDSFEHWLVLSLILGLMSQVLFMPLSGQLYDAMFDAAHLLKVGSYLCALAGLLFGMRHLFSESFAQQELAFTNAILATEQEASPDAILVVDERARIISYNRRFVDLWGLTQEMVSARADEPVLPIGRRAGAGPRRISRPHPVPVRTPDRGEPRRNRPEGWPDPRSLFRSDDRRQRQILRTRLVLSQYHKTQARRTGSDRGADVFRYADCQPAGRNRRVRLLRQAGALE